MQLRNPAILSLALVLTPCVSAAEPWGYVEPSESDTSDDIGYVLIGMDPPPGLALFYAGKVEQGQFDESIWTRSTYAGYGEDGYVLFKARAGSTIALTEFKVDGFRWYKTQDETKIPVFTVQPGVVTYATDIHTTPTSEGVQLSYSQNLDAARAYMNTHHQPLAAKLQVGKFETMTFSPNTGTR